MPDWRAALSRIPKPRTLLWRTFLLIALLIALALFASLRIYQHTASEAHARQSAQLLVSIVNLTRSALLASDANQRFALLAELNTLEGIRVYPAEADDEIIAADDPMLLAEVRERIGEQTRLAIRLQGQPGFFVSFQLYADEQDEYWVMLPAERVAGPSAGAWLGWAAAVALLSLIGAWFLVLGITRPLKALEQAAHQVGRGELPTPLPEDGPHEIAEVAGAFNQMSRDLAQLESDRALILAGVSHDLRTPLSRLRLSIEMSGATAEDVEAMGSDIEEMDRIIRQFLDFARGNEAEAIAPVALHTLTEEIVQAYARRGRPVRLHTVEPLTLHTRPMGVRRAITNLIDNALRYAGENTPIDVGVRLEPEGWCCVEVADRGPGIPPGEVERLKRPFTRLESARTNAGGSGLGLAIIDRFARSQNGRLDLLPREGGGLQARLLLPSL